MKRILIVVFMILAFTASASAESSQIFGIKGGLNMFRFYGDDTGDLDYLYAYAIGVSYSYGISELFVIQPELYYSIKGWRIKEANDLSLKAKYIDIPVLFKVNLPIEGKCWAPNLYAGPYLAFLLAADIGDANAKDELNSTDLGLVVGAGLDFRLSEGMRLLSFDFRYSIGFTQVPKEDADTFNNGFQFLLGYGFSL